jgi:hypothetical protein
MSKEHAGDIGMEAILNIFFYLIIAFLQSTQDT